MQHRSGRGAWCAEPQADLACNPNSKPYTLSQTLNTYAWAGREGQNGLHSRSLSGEGLPGSLLGPGGRRRTSSSQQGSISTGPGPGRSRRVSYATPPFLASHGPDPGRSPFETELTAVSIEAWQPMLSLRCGLSGSAAAGSCMWVWVWVALTGSFSPSLCTVCTFLLLAALKSRLQVPS